MYSSPTTMHKSARCENSRINPPLNAVCFLALALLCAVAGHAWSAATFRTSSCTTLCAAGPAGLPSSTEVRPCKFLAHITLFSMTRRAGKSAPQPGLSRQAVYKRTAWAGYYSRFMALRHLLLQFLGRGSATSAQPMQVLSLGAGYDTTFFQLEVRDKQTPGGTVACWQLRSCLQPGALTSRAGVFAAKLPPTPPHPPPPCWLDHNLFVNTQELCCPPGLEQCSVVFRHRAWRPRGSMSLTSGRSRDARQQQLPLCRTCVTGWAETQRCLPRPVRAHCLRLTGVGGTCTCAMA